MGCPASTSCARAAADESTKARMINAVMHTQAALLDDELGRLSRERRNLDGRPSPVTLKDRLASSMLVRSSTTSGLL
jgi:hypothetical protein